MKKFTGNFLLGEHGPGNVLRKIGLSMVAILMAVAAFAQPQETYHVWADDVSDCYRYDNDYEVPVSFRDFVKIDTFKLVMEYDADVFSWTGVSGVNAVLATKLKIVEAPAGTLTITWDSQDDPVGKGTILPDDVKKEVFTLHFALDGYPHAYGPAGSNQYVFDTDLEWDNDASFFYNEYGQVVQILTEFTTDGSLTVTQGMELEDITLEAGAADCDGEQALVMVTAPTGKKYSWNGSTFTSFESTNITAPSEDNTLRVKDGDCVSYYYYFDAEAPDVLKFEVDEVVETDCPGGLGDIQVIASGGNKPYTYYLLTDDQFDELDFDGCCDCVLSTCIENEYTSGIFEVPVGVYYVTVSDANDCLNLCDPENWVMVEVVDPHAPWYITAEVDDLQCYNQPAGRIQMWFAGATPYNNDATEEYGYKLWFNNAYQGIVWDFDSNNDDDEPVLAAGSYTVHLQDANGCTWDTTIVVDQPDPITFDLGHTDTGCEEDNGTIWIVDGSIEGGTFEGGDAYWFIDTLPNFPNTPPGTPIWMGDLDETATGLPAGVYYVRVVDDNGCFGDYRNINEDNAIKILDYDLLVSWPDIKCHGETTTVTVTLETGSGNHDLEYKLVPMTPNWGSVITPQPFGDDNVFEDVPSGWYKVAVQDNTVDCIYRQYIYISQPDPIWATIVPHMTLPPTCPGNTDGNLVIWVTGGTPFETTVGGNTYTYYKYKMDDGEWIQASEYNTFAIDTADHWIYIEDANGCTQEVLFHWPHHFNNIIDFVDTIYNECALGEINLFNRYPERDRSCRPMPHPVGEWGDWNGDNNANGPFYFWNPAYYDCEEGVDIDFGYLNYFEWYGIPIEHFTGAITFDINIWTSDSGWVTRTLDGIQQFRNPVLYITDEDPDGNPQAIVDLGEVVGHDSSFPAGTYWLVSMDEWGCFSNIEEITIIDPLPLAIEVSTVDAGCAGSTDGKIMIEAFNGRFPIPNIQKPFARYQYVLTQQPQIFTHPNWVGEVTWSVFTSGDFANDSVAKIAVQDGEYWIAVRDWCGVENTELIQFAHVTIEGADPVEIAWDNDMIKPVTCNIMIWDEDEEDYVEVSDDDGALTGLLAATTGGFGDYIFTLDYLGRCDGDEGRVTVKSASASRWPEINTTGEFDDLPAGCYILTVEDDSLGCQAVYEIMIHQPGPLELEPVAVNASCNDAHDGIIRYIIHGGTAPFWESTNNISENWEDPANPALDLRWVETASEATYVEAHDAFIFDRRVREGEYKIWIKDANGCIFELHDPVIISEPDPLAILDVEVTDVSCFNPGTDNDPYTLEEGNTSDGGVEFTIEGGWNLNDDFMYYVELWKGSTKKATQTLNWYDNTTTLSFNNYPAGDYTLKLYEHNPDIWDDPIMSYLNYFEDHTWLGWPKDDNGAIYQNPFLSKADTEDACYVTYNFTIHEPDPIAYEREWVDVICYNTHTGMIKLWDIMGGKPHVKKTDPWGGYLVGLEGPEDYDPTLQSNWDDNYVGTSDGIAWFETGLGENSFTFDNLIWGHYTIHIKDGNDCWIYKESGEVENQDELVIDYIELIENVKCYGDTTGIVQLHVDGGVPPYEYAVAPANYEFEDDEMSREAFFNSLYFRSMNDSIYVPAGVWIAFVRDAMGCITGFSTDMMGDPVTVHRVVVEEPDPVEAGQFHETPATCFGEDDGKIKVDAAWGGNGGAWRIEIDGTDYDGNPVHKVYTNIKTWPYTCTGLPASTNKKVEDMDEWTDEDFYTLVVYDHEGCVSEGYDVYVTHPDLFVITIESKQDAFVCNDDQAGLYEIVVVSGGNPFGYDANEDPVFEYKWEAYADAEHTELIDELSDDEYGFINTFLGYADIHYLVYARDAKGCIAETDTFIVAPAVIEFEVKNITCWNDPKASAKVTAHVTNGRKWHVLYKEIEGDTPAPATWTVFNGWAEEGGDIVMQDTFIYDTENIADVHYVFVVEDSLGCRSLPDTMTFDIVQEELQVIAAVTVPGECTSEAEMQVVGGTKPYKVMVNGEEVTEMTQVLGVGTYEVMVEDANECMAMASFEVVADPVVREDEVETYIGEEVAYTDAEAGIDTMLAEGEHTFTYTHTNGCVRTLVVTVVGVPRVVTIAAVQGEADASPWLDAVVQVTATVTAVAPGEGFFMQDANGAWNGIWVEYSAATSGGIQIGNGVVVVGTVVEVASVTTLQASSVALVAPVVTITPTELAAPSDAENEMYESVLVKVKGARATAVDAGSGEWTIYYQTTDDVVVNDWLYPYTPTEGNWYNVTGVVNARLDAFKLEPRKVEDVTDLTITDVELTPVNVQFKVYPNPFNDRIYIDNNDKLTRVVISNIAGQRVIDVEYPEHEIRTANLVSGVYVVSMFTESGIAKTERIVKR